MNRAPYLRVDLVYLIKDGLQHRQQRALVLLIHQLLHHLEQHLLATGALQQQLCESDAIRDETAKWLNGQI